MRVANWIVAQNHTCTSQGEGEEYFCSLPGTVEMIKNISAAKDQYNEKTIIAKYVASTLLSRYLSTIPDSGCRATEHFSSDKLLVLSSEQLSWIVPELIEIITSIGECNHGLNELVTVFALKIKFKKITIK